MVKGDKTVTFWVYFVVRALADLFPAILIALLDTITITMVKQHGGDFGRHKMYGLVAVSKLKSLLFSFFLSLVFF